MCVCVCVRVRVRVCVYLCKAYMGACNFTADPLQRYTHPCPLPTSNIMDMVGLMAMISLLGRHSFLLSSRTGGGRVVRCIDAGRRT